MSYNEKTGKYTLLADRCILGRMSLVSKILSRMNLPVRGAKWTQIATTVVTAAWGATANSLKTGAGSEGLFPQWS